MADLTTAAKAVDALWDEPDPGSDDNIWMTEDEGAMATALRDLRAALAANPRDGEHHEEGR